MSNPGSKLAVGGGGEAGTPEPPGLPGEMGMTDLLKRLLCLFIGHEWTSAATRRH